jgi:hypothetical protein
VAGVYRKCNDLQARATTVFGDFQDFNIVNYKRRSIFPGNSIIPLSKMKTPSTDIFTSLKGNNSSHTTG